MNKFFRYLEMRSRASAARGVDQRSRDDEYEELRRLWEASVPPDIQAPSDVDDAWQRLQIEISHSDEPGRVRPRASVWNIAEWWPPRAALAGGIGLAIITALLLIPSLLGESYRTGPDGQLTVTLPDSSTVTLRENSSFSVHLSLFGGMKGMTLKGGGFFSVKPQVAPFIVTTSIGSVRVVGTQFDVRCDSKQLYVAVTRGTVAVSSSSNDVDSTVFVRKGEFVSCVKGGEPSAPGKSMTGGGPMWLSGVFTISHADLRSMCDEIGRQMGVHIELNRGDLDTVKVSGLIRGRDTRQILSALCELTGTAYRVENNVYVVY